jgi:SAM-dependent methyltransferase
MVDLLEDKDFKKFLVSGGGRYQPIPIHGLFNPQAVRARGCIERWENVCKILPKDKPQRILDVGCSLGYFGLVGADAGHFVDGFDIEKEVIFWGNKIIEEYNIPNVNLWVSSEDLLQNLREISDDSYDYVFYFSLHHHICSALGVEKANEVLQEMSRIAPNMVFDMGQSNEVDNGWLTWLRKIPQFENHRIELPEWVLENSRFDYAACIGSSISHEIDRLLFLFVRDAPIGVDHSKKLITAKVPSTLNTVKGYNVKYYIWKDRGGLGKIRFSATSFPVMDLRSTMSTRYYVVTDLAGAHFFVKEYLHSWLSSNKDYERARITYENGKALQNIPEVRDRVVSPVAIDGSMVIYPYHNWPALCNVITDDLKHNFLNELIEVAGRIYRELGVFDLNLNNILYNKETGEFKLIDFEPNAASNFTYKIFTGRIAHLFKFFEKAFGE